LLNGIEVVAAAGTVKPPCRNALVSMGNPSGTPAVRDKFDATITMFTLLIVRR
jgi:hypothetical protein